MKRMMLTIAIITTLMVPVQSFAFFGSMINGMTSVANNMVDGMTETANNGIDTAEETSIEMLSLMSKLSDDIGIMADRILTMADKIGEMADRIGEMADRIVATEQMMADLVESLQSNALGINGEEVVESVVLDAALNGSTPQINLSNGASEYLLYASDTLQMGTDTVSVLIRSNTDLDKFWPMMMEMTTDNQLFIAVKSVDGNTISSLSNVVLIAL